MKRWCWLCGGQTKNLTSKDLILVELMRPGRTSIAPEMYCMQVNNTWMRLGSNRIALEAYLMCSERIAFVKNTWMLPGSNRIGPEVHMLRTRGALRSAYDAPQAHFVSRDFDFDAPEPHCYCA